MHFTEISEDILHVISTFVLSNHDLTRFSQVCRSVYWLTKGEIERRKFIQLYSTIDIDEELIYDFHLNDLDGKDLRAARYIQDILDEPRIGSYVRTLRLRKDIALRILRNSLNPDFLLSSSSYNIPEREIDFVNKTIDGFSFLRGEAKQIWKSEALHGHFPPLVMVLFTLCRKAKMLDLLHASDQILPYLASLLESLVKHERSPHFESPAIVHSINPLPAITNLRIANVTLKQVVKFFTIPSLRKVEAFMIKEDDGEPIDVNYLAEIGEKCNVEVLVLATARIEAETLAHLIRNMPKLNRLEFSTPASQWSLTQPGVFGLFDPAAIEHVRALIRSVEQLAGVVLGHRRLGINLALVEEQRSKCWRLTIAKTDDPLMLDRFAIPLVTTQA